MMCSHTPETTSPIANPDRPDVKPPKNAAARNKAKVTLFMIRSVGSRPARRHHTRRAASRRKSALRFAAPDHLFAVRIEGVVHDPLGCNQLMIVLVAEMAKALRNGIQAGSFGLVPECVVGVGPVDDL